ncbi:MAG: hypothetical protein FWC67_00820, partial [Defluviitaleaceae bacterium]|nr:hypothetical protein [Defluviitaleaceae bacterium]
KRILFVTPPYMATNILIDRTMQAAENAGLELSIEVMDDERAFATLERETFDMMLVNPLLRFFRNDPSKIAALGATPMVIVGSKIYGSLDGEGMVKLILEGGENREQ